MSWLFVHSVGGSRQNGVMKTASLTDADERAAARLDALVPQLVEVRRRLARLQAEEARLLAETSEIAEEWRHASPPSQAELPHRTVAAEIATAWRVSDRTVQREMSDADRLVHEFPATLAALEQGRIARGHVRVITSAGVRITRPELRAQFEASVLPYAEQTSPSRLTPIARRRAQWCLDETITQRHRRARNQRHLTVTDLEDGMAQLVLVASAVLLHGVVDRATTLAHTITAARRDGAAAGTAAGDADGDTSDAPDTRTIDQLRADVLIDLLLTADPTAHDLPTGAAAIRGSVAVTVPVLSLLDDRVTDPFETAVLDGYGPIDLDTARELAANAPGWDRILTHPITGAVLAVDRYRPSKKMHRHLNVRDRRCRFPGCHARARDIDHTIDHARGGPTHIRNLAGFCRRHHTLKHHSPWQVRQLGGGHLEWTSPTGRIYIDRPHSQVEFSTDPEHDPPPF